MMRASLHEFLGKTMLEIEVLGHKPGLAGWVSICRVLIGDAEQVLTVAEAADALIRELQEAASDLQEDWDTRALLRR
jgi:hypothetical protein